MISPSKNFGHQRFGASLIGNTPWVVIHWYQELNICTTPQGKDNRSSHLVILYFFHDWFNLYPFPVTSHNRGYTIFQWVLWVFLVNYWNWEWLWKCTELQLVSEVRVVLWSAPTYWLANCHSWPKLCTLNHVFLKASYLRSFLATWQVNYESFPSDSTYRSERKEKLDE